MAIAAERKRHPETRVMDSQQAARFAEAILAFSLESEFSLEVEDSSAVGAAFKQLGCTVKYNMFRPDVLEIRRR
jgi:hypothetical protein